MTLARAAFPFLRPILHALDAETAHRATIALLKAAPCAQQDGHSGLATRCFGLGFPSPLGLAAGFDKNAEVPDAMLAQGFGFVAQHAFRGFLNTFAELTHTVAHHAARLPLAGPARAPACGITTRRAASTAHR